ncbi:MAG: MBL fold metallo-hydrolase [Acidobacteria bacterium]|nr:MBL fold metallo-hydrolase [Acidobacteriota bacterium]
MRSNVGDRWEVSVLKVCVLATSSSGNCTFIGTGATRILIDAGLSARETAARLEAIGERLDAIDAILVTHEHSDHVCGLPVLLKKLGVPVYVSEITSRQIDWSEAESKKRGAAVVRTFAAGAEFTVGEFKVQSFSVPHDAVDACGFTVAGPAMKIGLAMDLGYVPENVRYQLDGCELVVLESNHDLEMLKVGPYPWALKQRVMGRRGHLSNDLAAEYLLESFDARVGTLVLGHLSEQNNHPEIARMVAQQAIERRALRTRLVVTEPRKQSEVFSF